MIIETIEGYTSRDFFYDMFHIDIDCFGEEQWIMDGNLYIDKSQSTPIKIRITVEQLEDR